jgi:hypothetical protein
MAERVSTLDDLKKLEVFAPRPGEVVTWEAFEEVLAPLTRKERRFRTVYRAWIRHVRQWHNRKAVVLPGVGIRILAEHERTRDVHKTLTKTWTTVERAKTDVDDIQIVELTPQQLDVTHHVRTITHRMHRTLRDEQVRLAEVLPKPDPTPTPQVYGRVSGSV